MINKRINPNSSFIFARHANNPEKQKKRLNLKIMRNLKNRVNLIGNLGMNPEIKKMESGQKLAKVSIATNESYKNNKGERVSETQWHNLVAWGKLADIIEKYTKVGSRVVVEGKLTTRQYTDKAGLKKQITEIQVSEMMILNGAGKEEE
jgi:single-strand DNA-binding protein